MPGWDPARGPISGGWVQVFGGFALEIRHGLQGGCERYSGMRQTEMLGGDHGAIRCCVPDQHIRLPFPRDLHEARRPQACAYPAEEPWVAEQFTLEPQGHRLLLGPELLVFRIVRPAGTVYLQKGKAGGFYQPLQGRTRREGHLMPFFFQGAGEGHQRVKVAVAATHTKQEAPC